MQVLLQRLRDVAVHHPDAIMHAGELYRWVGYHGTNDTGAHSIRTEGIKLTGRGDLGLGFYTSDQIEIALDSAVVAATARGGEPDIVNIYVREQAWSAMRGFIVPEGRLRKLYDPAWTQNYDYLTAEVAGWTAGAHQLKFNPHAVQYLIGG